MDEAIGLLGSMWSLVITDSLFEGGVIWLHSRPHPGQQ